MKVFAMQSFKKLLQKRDVSQSKSAPNMKWFNRSTDGNSKESSSSPLQNEIDFVPRTEFSASRQALSNINIALSVGESSGAVSGAKGHSESDKKGCKNKYCCGAEYMDVQVHHADNDNSESMENHKKKKSTFIDNSRLTDNNAHASNYSIFNEPDFRQPSRVIKEVKNRDYIYYFDPYADYGRIECPDSFYPSLVDYPMVRYGKYVQLKTVKQRNCSQTFDLFTSSDKLKSAENDKSSINYELLSNVESRLDETKYNLLKCKSYNDELKMLNKRFGCKDCWIHEDFNDDSKSTRMSADTRTIKEFYKLSVANNVLVHYQDIVVETGRTVERNSDNILNFFSWIILKGKEITEQHKADETSWIKTILKFLKPSSE